MVKNLLLSVLFLLLSLKPNLFFGQNRPYISTSLSFEELERKIEQQNIHSEIGFDYIKVYIAKAKNEQNLEKLYRGYSLAGFSNQGDVQIKYGDSLILTAVKIKDNDKIGEAFVSSANTYMGSNDYKNALEQLLIAFDYFKINNNEYLLNTAKYNIANIKKYTDDYAGAKEIYTETTHFFRNHQEKIKDTNYQLYYIYSLGSLIDCNTRLENFAENKKLIAEGLNAISQQKDLAEYKGYFISSEGTDAYFLKKYTLAISKLNQALHLYDDEWKHLTEKFYIGMSYMKMNQPEKAIPYFKIIEKEYDDTRKINPEFRPAIAFFSEYYKNKGDKAQELFYINKLLTIDEDLKINKKITSEINKNYDVENLLQEKFKIENERVFERYAIIGGLGLLVSALFVMIKTKKRRQKKSSLSKIAVPKKVLEKRENTLKNDEVFEISLVNSSTAQAIEETKNEIDFALYKPINKTTVEQLLQHLEIFERKKGFTEHNLKLYDLAKKFNTNEKYLSKIILINKGKSFNKYVIDLRLDYYMERFKDKSTFKNITELSQQSGFDNYPFFSKEFKDRFKVNPNDMRENSI